MEATLSPNEYNTANYYWNLISHLSWNVRRSLAERLSKSMTTERQEATKAQQIKEKYKNLEISPEIQALCGCVQLSEDDLKDERTQYILSK